jgi:hypothetical protein
VSDITVDMHEVAKFLSDLGALEGTIIPLAHRYMRISVDTMEAEVVGRTPVGATGNLRGSIGTEIRGARLDIRGEVGTAILYGEPAERGRRSGRMPPVDPIEYWVVRKGIAPAGPESRNVAWLIARAIGHHGTKGAHMFERGFEAAEPKVLSLWRGLPDRIAQELSRG